MVAFNRQQSQQINIMQQDSSDFNSETQSQSELTVTESQVGSESQLSSMSNLDSEKEFQRKKQIQFFKKNKQIFQNFQKTIERFEKDFEKEKTEMKFVVQNCDKMMFTFLIDMWMRRQIRTDKFVITLQLRNVNHQEFSLEDIVKMSSSLGSMKLIVNEKLVQNKAILQLNGEFFYEGTDEYMEITSQVNKIVYRGQVLNKVYHGQGILVCGTKEGFEYQGSFENGKRHGKGQMKTKMAYYKGEFKNDQKDGELCEEIIFKRKKKEQGKTAIVRKSHYQGCFKNGYREGEGEQIMFGVYQFKGLWKKGEKSGHGVVDYTNGDKYEGNWENNEFNGIGKYIEKGNCVYQGEFKNGKYHGKGVMEYNNGDKYEGEFENGKKHGQGKYDWQGENDYYDGEWKNDSAQGQGTSMIKEEFYNGQFKNGKKHGEGELNTEEGDFIRGIWEDGNLKKTIEKNGEPVEEQNS